MGKRSDFKRRERDFYPTPPEAVIPLLPFIHDVVDFIEPCCGDGALIKALELNGKRCCWASDIEPRGPFMQRDALEITTTDLNANCPMLAPIITNPPWSRPALHQMIMHFSQIRPYGGAAYLLFDADWAHTKQAAPYLMRCDLIISVGRLKWIKDSPHTGKDNCCWYRFRMGADYTTFIGRDPV